MLFRRPYPDVPILEQSLTELVLQRAVELADKPALIEGKDKSLQRWTDW